MRAKQSLLRLALAGLAVLMTLVPTDGRCASAVHANSLDPDAEVLALEASGELLAPDALYQKMLGELTAIRAAYAAVSNIHARAAWVRGQLISERLTVRKKRCLRRQNLRQYKITRPRYSRGYRIITFTEHYNPVLLAALLHSTCGICSSVSATFSSGFGQQFLDNYRAVADPPQPSSMTK